MKTNAVQERQLQKETLRMETFSDGVFCIAVTLLFREIDVELHGDVTNKELTHALALSFVMWVYWIVFG